MSLFDWLPAERKAASLEEFLSAAGGSASGVSVTHESALKTSPALSCVRLLARGVARLPMRVHQDTGERTKRVAKDHPLYKVLYRKPNAWMTSFSWRQTMMFHTLITGSGRSFINRVNGQVAELLPLLPNQVEVKQDKNYDLAYKIRLANGETLDVDQSQIFDLRGPSWDSYQGLDSVKQGKEAIGLSLATEETHARLHSQGARPGGLLTSAGTLNPEQVDQIRTGWEQMQGGVHNAMKTAILGADLKWTPLAMTGVDSEHLATRKFQIEEICRAFGVFPQMIGHGDKPPTFASAQQFFLHHIIQILDPWVVEFEQTVMRDLLTEEELDDGYYVKLNLNEFLRGSMKERAEFYKIMVEIGVFSPNDVRELEDRNPYEGGDVYRAQMNTETIGGSDATDDDTDDEE